MKKLNVKDRLVVIWKWFKSLPKLEKPIYFLTTICTEIMLIIIKIVVPTAILIVAVYKYAEYKTKKKINEETAGNDSNDTGKTTTSYQNYEDLPDEIVIPDSVAK